MNEPQAPDTLDREAFQRVWRRVMPEDRLDCPFTLEAPEPAPAARPEPAPLPSPVQSPAFVQPLPRAAAPGLPLCLGEGSVGELPTIEALLLLSLDGWRIYRSLARRQQGNGRRGREERGGTLSELAEAKRVQARKLSAADFLISGRDHVAPPTDAPIFRSLPLALRERYQAEQLAAAQFLAAANASADPCLMELYRALALEDQLHAKMLRDLLVQMRG